MKQSVELSHERTSFLEDLATEIWSAHGSRTPTDVGQIVEDADISLDYDDYSDVFDGMIEHQNGRFHIYCNLALCGGQNTGRARFTLAHELGHYYIDEHRSALESGLAPSHAYNADRPSELRIEREADCFASALLMPSVAFRRETQGRPFGLQAILDAASTFQVSRQSAAKRYVRLSGLPCAMVFFRHSGSPWWDLSPALEEGGVTGVVRKDKPVVRGSATDQAQNSTDNGKIFETTTTASYWFWNITDGSARDVVLKEQAIRLGGYGVLTLLHVADPRSWKSH